MGLRQCFVEEGFEFAQVAAHEACGCGGGCSAAHVAGTAVFCLDEIEDAFVGFALGKWHQTMSPGSGSAPGMVCKGQSPGIRVRVGL